MKKLFKLTLTSVAALAMLITTGCGVMNARIRPGHSLVNTEGPGLTANSVQSQDPKQPMTQNVKTTDSDEKILPVGSVIVVPVPGTTNQTERVTLSAPMPVKHTTVKEIETKVGASQKDTAADITAKMASVRWIQWVGIVLALFGLAALFYPPLSLIIGSPTTAIACAAAGGALIFLPIVIVGHEILILGVAAAALLLWVFAHSHGSLTAELSTVKSFLSGTKTASTPAATPAAPATTTTSTTAPPTK